MGHLIEQYPIITSLIGFIVAIVAGAVDLIVLKNRVLAIVFWVWGFPVAVMPILWKESWGDIRWFLGAAIGVIYVIAAIWVYRVLAPEPSERPAAEDEG